MGDRGGRRVWIFVLLGSLLVLFLALAGLNAFNLRLLDPQSPLETLVFLALSVLAFLLFVSVLVVLVRNLLKLYSEKRSRVLGARLRSRMVWGAVLVSLVPLIFMLAFSYLLMNRAVDRWFSQPVTEMRDDASGLSAALERYASANARAEADTLALELTDTLPTGAGHDTGSAGHIPPAAFYRALQRHELSLQGGFAILYHDGAPVASLHLPDLPLTAISPPQGKANRATEVAVLEMAERSEGTLFSLGHVDYSLALAGLHHGGLVVVGLPLPTDVAATNMRLRKAANAYWTVFRERRQVRSLYTGLLLLITVLALFVCCWLALNTAKQVTRPVESLAEAMEAIAAGDYARRVEQSATEELGELADSFNAMAADLESTRSNALASATQLGELNSALERRRTELETIIETISTRPRHTFSRPPRCSHQSRVLGDAGSRRRASLCRLAPARNPAA